MGRQQFLHKGNPKGILSKTRGQTPDILRGYAHICVSLRMTSPTNLPDTTIRCRQRYQTPEDVMGLGKCIAYNSSTTTLSSTIALCDIISRLEPVSLAVLYAGLSPRAGTEGKKNMCMIVIVPKAILIPLTVDSPITAGGETTLYQ
jgi:hypothetical protein